ncbi:protein FAR1-RELATED SEQUENCE 5-like [Olea europaea var. sylvestris]|uniref:protein FAR1-RELATED SEQUENCE 5-like n=1 Tax=Olea europaea var. sylvestris TaxID=158386 RepID=UPI000C1D45D2|nr:protein FAR1-RELATED SEQUENCE 5-like [Olea europaea var. sylvestris]
MLNTEESTDFASESFSQVSENENTYPLVKGDDINADDLEVDEIAVDDFDGQENAVVQSIHCSVIYDKKSLIIESTAIWLHCYEGIDIIVPRPGMKFKDENEIFKFYKKYAYQVGFPVRKRNSRKGEDGIVGYVCFTCGREGRQTTATSSSLNPQPTIQTGCKARVTACSEIGGTWRINTVYLEHNHRTSPSKSRLYRCNREISACIRRQLEINDIAGISLHKSFNSAVVEAGGYDKMVCVEKDCRNFIDKVRRLRLGEGDTTAIQAFFSRMQTSTPGFYFSIDLDEDCPLRNVFWADNKCKEVYKEFGDVITFDTTYLTNKYDMPFAPFVGVNHHNQSTLLGCSLILNEDTWTFVWLFKTWLECMHGQAPSGIITDQDRVMENVIEIVFPNTRHRLCLWHILKKLPEKFGNHRYKNSILSSVHGLVYDTQSPPEFEEKWHTILVRYELEGINAFFDGYVHSKTSLKQFVEQYEQALRSKVEKEFQADFKSFSQMVPCAIRYDMEKQFQSVYTISKFKEFQQEFTEKVYCEILSVTDSYLIPLTRGIICKHAISVLIRNDVVLIPERYILKRWRQDVNRPYMRVPIKYDGFVSSVERIMDLIMLETTEASQSKCINVGSQCADSVACASRSILDPKYTKHKGAPRKLRRKGHLETSSSKSKSSRKVPMHKRQNKLVSSTFTTKDVGTRDSFEVL